MKDLLARVAELVASERARLDTKPVREEASVEELRGAFGGPVPETGTDTEKVVDELAAAASPGLVGSAGPRYFGFVIGGSHPAALAADWLTSGWDNNSGLYVCAPAPSIIEETAARWVVDLLGLPSETSAGFV